MQFVTSTQAKQSFGELLEATANGPVEIRRHGKVKAILTAPGHFMPCGANDARRVARERQAAVEQARLLKHHQVALALLTATPANRALMVRKAREVVRRWRDEGLSSSDYVQRWTTLLALPVKELAVAMTSDLDGWGNALRQNSPWIGPVA